MYTTKKKYIKLVQTIVKVSYDTVELGKLKVEGTGKKKASYARILFN